MEVRRTCWVVLMKMLPIDDTANTQSLDQYGNSTCIYASCDDVPVDGCIYPDAFGTFADGFGPAQCTEYGGTPCESTAGDVEGCLDPNATNYDANATVQAVDQYGNQLCIYASCDDVPSDGCRYDTSFAPWNDSFNAANCTEYGGTPCESTTADIEGCIDENATNYDDTANTQSFDQYGNSTCIYASCDDVPVDGCIYVDGFGPFEDGFGPTECTSYSGTPCESATAVLMPTTNAATVIPDGAVVVYGADSNIATNYDPGWGQSGNGQVDPAYDPGTGDLVLAYPNSMPGY